LGVSCVGVSKEDLGVLVDRRFCRCWSRWPFAVAVEGGRCWVMARVVRPGHVAKKLFCTACRKVEVVGLKQAAWRYWMCWVAVEVWVLFSFCLVMALFATAGGGETTGRW